MVFGTPDVLRPGAVAPEPQHALNTPQIPNDMAHLPGPLGKLSRLENERAAGSGAAFGSTALNPQTSR